MPFISLNALSLQAVELSMLMFIKLISSKTSVCSLFTCLSYSYSVDWLQYHCTTSTWPVLPGCLWRCCTFIECLQKSKQSITVPWSFTISWVMVCFTFIGFNYQRTKCITTHRQNSLQSKWHICFTSKTNFQICITARWIKCIIHYRNR